MLIVLSLPNFKGGVHNSPRGSISILRRLGQWELGRRSTHSHKRTCPIHTCVRGPFTQADVLHSHFGAHCPIHTGCPSSSDPVPLDSWMLTGKFPKWASESPSPAPPPTAVHILPRLASERPAPPFAPLAHLPHPFLRAHLYSPSSFVFIFLSRICAGSFVYVLLPLSCAANHHSLVVLHVVSRAYQTCIQGSSQMLRSTRSAARRGANNRDPAP